MRDRSSESRIDNSHPPSLQLAFSSNAYLNFSIEETISRIAGLGYAGLELLADVPHAWPAGLLPERSGRSAIAWSGTVWPSPTSTAS